MHAWRDRERHRDRHRDRDWYWDKKTDRHTFVHHILNKNWSSRSLKNVQTYHTKLYHLNMTFHCCFFLRNVLTYNIYIYTFILHIKQIYVNIHIKCIYIYTSGWLYIRNRRCRPSILFSKSWIHRNTWRANAFPLQMLHGWQPKWLTLPSLIGEFSVGQKENTCPIEGDGYIPINRV